MEGKIINNSVEKITFHILSIFNKNTHGNKLECVDSEMSLYILIQLTSRLKYWRSVITVKTYLVITLCILNKCFPHGTRNNLYTRKVFKSRKSKESRKNNKNDDKRQSKNLPCMNMQVLARLQCLDFGVLVQGAISQISQDAT